MYVIISPAKKQQWDQLYHPHLATTRRFEAQTRTLVETLKQLDAPSLMTLMHISPKLAEQNFDRYQDFSDDLSKGQSALFAFQGDVYQAMQADLWDEATCLFAQDHMGILSGLYGLLRPMDVIQPYRLEMKTKLHTPSHPNLYAFWGHRLSCALNEAVGDGVCINLASGEYAKAVQTSSLTVPMIDVVFKQRRAGALKTIGVMAKRARGAMTGWIMTHKITEAKDLFDFNALGYQYAHDLSSDHQWVFVSDR